MTTEDDGPEDEQHESGDPFEELETDVDRDGDPFETLSGETTNETELSTEESTSTDPKARSKESPAESEWIEEFKATQGVQTGWVSESETGPVEEKTQSQGEQETNTVDVFDNDDSEESSVPFRDVGQREGDPFEEGGLFEEREMGDLDPDSVWKDLEGTEEGPAETAGRERTYAEVSKHSYCEQCEYFSAPPEIACRHDEAAIVEFLDMETVRVVDCPIVAERLELERDG